MFRIFLVSLMAVLTTSTEISDKNWCDRICPNRTSKCPSPCPQLFCPTPECPQSLCPTPQCPQPVVNLTCPEPRCSCPVCPPPPPKHVCRICPPCPTLETTTFPPLPPFYEKFPRYGSYRFYSNRKTWLEANKTCSQDGGYLAIPDNKDELGVIVKILRRENTDAYVGFHDFHDEGNYRTALGQPMNVFQRSLWGVGEPDGGDTRNGVFMSIEGKLYDYLNLGEEEFLCEYP